MGFLVQNDSGGIGGANAYVTVAEFRAYHADRGTDVVGYVDADVQTAVVRATDYLDTRFTFRGDKVTTAQRTAWPRTGPEDDDELVRVGVPVEVKEACSEYALVALTTEVNPSPDLDSSGRAVQSKSSSVGPISESISYVGGAVFQMPKYPKADQKLRGLIVSGLTLGRA